MKKRLIAHITILMMLFSMLGGMLLSAGASVGSVTYVHEMTIGSPMGTYYVETEEDLSYLAELVNGGMTMEGYTFLQTKDITLTAENFTTIGYRASGTDYRRFSGTYDGQRHTISNLQFYDKTRDGAGLFGYAFNATLKNIGIESGSITAANRAGGIAGYGDGCTYINCYNKANVTILSGTDGVGGIAGVARNAAYAYGCYNIGTITGTSGGISGIIGWAGQYDNSMVIGCYNAGTLKNTATLSGTVPMDPIARSSRIIGDNSTNYFLSSIHSSIDSYNFKNAQKLTKADNQKMAYVMNHAPGSNTNAFTLDESGAIVFSKDETEGVMDLCVKAMRGGVLISDTDFVRTSAGGYTVPATYESYEVLNAIVGEESYEVGAFIPADTVAGLTVTLTLAGSFPSLSDYNENTEAAAFTVSTVGELAMLAEMVDAGNSFAGKTIYVTQDLDFADYPTWNGIGHATGSGGGVVAEGSLPFSGTFDGQFHHFKNINFKSNARYTAIFSHTEGATLKNMIFDEGTVHVSSRTSGVLIGLMSNTTVMNMENHVSVYADQVTTDADNLGFVAMSTNGSVIKNVVSYGEIGLLDKTAITQQNGGLIGWGYNKTSVDNCIVVGKVYGTTYHPIARGATITNSYYLPHQDETGTMTYEALMSGEASYNLNKIAGTNLWGLGEQGPVLDPAHPVFPMHFVVNDADAAVAATDPVISGTVTEYHVAGEEGTLYVPAGYKAVLGRKYWPLTDAYVMPCYEESLSLWYSRNSYDITYVTNGGVFVVQPNVTAISGLAQQLPDKSFLHRDGYVFAGWYDNAQLSGDAVTLTPTDLYHGVTYYAAWVEATKIATVEEFLSMEMDGNYLLTADLDFSGVDYAPIGSYDSPFTGFFDGDGHTISGVKIESTGEYQGLFGVNKGVICNLVLEDSTVTGNAYVGGIVGDNLGTVENCISAADVTATGTKAQASFNMVVQNLKVNPNTDRLNNMKKRFDAYDADVMLLQEASEPWINFLNTNYVSTGEYVMFYKYRYEFSDAPDAAFKAQYPTQSLESTPVLYKPEKFNLIDSGYFWMTDTPDVISRPEGAKHFRICSWAVLEEKASGRYAAFFSIHLDTGGDEVRAINAQAVMKKAGELREKYASKDLMMVIAGDYNARIDSKAYNTVFTGGDIINAVYEITKSLEPATIDHVGLSENNIRAVDESFKYLWGEYTVEPSDHKGIYVELESLVNTNLGGICGSNSGTVRNCVAKGTVSGKTACGSLAGRNLGTVDGAYYVSGEPFGLTKAEYPATQMTSVYEAARALNLNSVISRFTVEGEELSLFQSGEEPLCITENGINEAHQYERKVVASTCTEGGYTVDTCTLCGHQCYFEQVAALGHQYGEYTATDAMYHQRGCSVCNDVEYTSHTFAEEQMSASCETHGGTRFTCVCGYSYDEWNDDAKSHIWSSYGQKDEATHLLICARVEGHTLQKAHTFTASAVDATCEAAGGNQYTCGCAYGYFVAEGSPLGHSYGGWSRLDNENHQAVCAHDAGHLTTAPHSYAYDAEKEAYICVECDGVYAFTGDLNGDGLADTADAILLLRRISGWKGEIPDHAADVNCDGKIKIYDAVLFLQKLLG